MMTAGPPVVRSAANSAGVKRVRAVGSERVLSRNVFATKRWPSPVELKAPRTVLAIGRAITAAALALPVSGGAVRALAILLTVLAVGVGAGTTLLPGEDSEPKPVAPLAAAPPIVLDDPLPAGATMRVHQLPKLSR